MSMETESRTALHELIALLREIDQRWSGPEWNLHSAQDVVGSHRALMHILEAGLVGYFEQNASNPDFRRIVTPSRKLTGDNSDAIYFDAPVSPDHSYVIHGTLEGAAYFSLTIEVGAEDGHMASNTAGVINDNDLEIDSNGHFTLYLGGEPRTTNWLALAPGSSRVTTRHYFEDTSAAAMNPDLEPRMRIECLSATAAPPPPDDASVAAGIRRVCNAVRSRTLGMPPMANSEPPPFLSLTPNTFPVPIPPGDFGLAAFDAHYSMAPFFIDSDQALVITVKFIDLPGVCSDFDQVTVLDDRTALAHEFDHDLGILAGNFVFKFMPANIAGHGFGADEPLVATGAHAQRGLVGIAQVGLFEMKG